MNLLAGGSILAAFFAGSVALFSPCCIVFLLPAYLASALQGRRWALFPLTAVFATGLAVVVMPLTLGVGLLASALTRYHLPLYLTGGLLMLILGGLAIAGRSWTMPGLRAPALRSDAAGVFALGVFSGIASSCCAPVLAGVLALSALAGSLPGSFALGLAYVFGMVFPLFVIALAWDRLRLGERKLLAGRDVTIRVAGRLLRTSTTNLIVGIAFLGMGFGVIALALLGNPTAAPGVQIGVGRFLTRALASVLDALAGVPEPLLGVALLGVAAIVVGLGIRGSRRVRTDRKESCHDNHDGFETHPVEPQRAGAAPRS